jgi:hypothetical protein
MYSGLCGRYYSGVIGVNNAFRRVLCHRRENGRVGVPPNPRIIEGIPLMPLPHMEAPGKILNETVEPGGQDLQLEELIQTTRREVEAVGLQVAGVKEDLSRVAGQVARLQTMLARMALGDGKKKPVL